MKKNFPIIYDKNNNKQDIFSLSIVIFITFIAAAFTYTAFAIHGGLFSDEHFHAPQIWKFYTGSHEFSPNITTPPTFHYFLSFTVQQIGYYHNNVLKLICLLISLLSIPIFYKLIKRYHPYAAGTRTLQLFFLPVMNVFYFLVYTDVWAVMLISLSWYLVLTQRYTLSAIAGLTVVCLRQDAIIWIGLSFLLLCFEKGYPVNLKTTIEFVKNALKKGFLFLLLFSGYLAFLVYNGGVAVGDRNAHVAGTTNITNVYFFLIIGWFLFLPLNIKLIPEIIKWLNSPWKIVLLIVCFFIYMGTLKNPHGYNNTMFEYFVHNNMARFLTTNIFAKSISYLLATWMLISLIIIKLPEPRFKWLFFVIPLALALHPMIDSRYYFSGYVLIHLLRPAMPQAIETATLYCYILLSAYVIYGTITGSFFL